MHVMKSLKIVKWEYDEKQGRNCWVENLKENNTIGFSCGYVGTKERKRILIFLVLEYETCFHCFLLTRFWHYVERTR